MTESTPTTPPNEPAWQLRFRAARMTLPRWARLRPERSIFTSNASGTVEIYAWDRSRGTIHQLTKRPAGTYLAAIDPAGEQVWWFDDDGGNEFGVWRRQPFPADVPDDARRSALPASSDLPPSYPAGLALGRSGTAVLGRCTDAATSVHLVRPDGSAHQLIPDLADGEVGALSADGRLLALAHAEHGDARHKALRVVALDDSGTRTVADLWDGPGLGLTVVDFAPRDGDPRLLVLHERRGRVQPLVWNPLTGEQFDPDIDLPGDMYAEWYPDGAALLVGHDLHARTELYRFDLASGTWTRIPTRAGTISGATVRPDGVVEFLWSSSAEPPAVVDDTGRVVIQPPGPAAPASVPATDAWVDGPGGRIPALISRPPGKPPYPTVFLVHGGPASHDTDSFTPAVAAWVDAGFAVVRVNYRGSTGYGKAWRDAIEGRPGLTELADLRAVRDWAVTTGLSDPRRLVLAGGSWGGYLTLLGIGVMPEAWSVGIASVPVADYVTAYYEEMEPLKAFDRALFGGTPEEVPERYREASPITYVDQVRAPVFILAGENDPRCPIRQVENYVDALAQRGITHEVYRFDAGHGSLVTEERIRQVGKEIAFALRHLGMHQDAFAEFATLDTS